MRADAVLRVLLNVPIFKGFSYRPTQDKFLTFASTVALDPPDGTATGAVEPEGKPSKAQFQQYLCRVRHSLPTAFFLPSHDFLRFYRFCRLRVCRLDHASLESPKLVKKWWIALKNAWKNSIEKATLHRQWILKTLPISLLTPPTSFKSYSSYIFTPHLIPIKPRGGFFFDLSASLGFSCSLNKEHATTTNNICRIIILASDGHLTIY